MTPHYQDDRVTLHAGDCLDILTTIPDNSIDSVVTDPPYSLGFMGRSWDAHDEHEDAGFAYWFTGFTDGEGCFRVQRHERGTYTCTFSIKVRRDERGTLERCQRALGGIGTIRGGEGSGNAHPQVTWAVQDKAGCIRLVRLFDKYPLRAKKRLDYEPWAEAVVEWTTMQRGNRWHGQSDWSRMAELKGRVEGARAYADPPWSGHAFQDWCRQWATECLRVLKPGGHLLSFGGTRTWHRLACAVEDAGFETRDSIAWLYGSGFPKSLDVGKAIDKAAGATREVVSTERSPFRMADPKMGDAYMSTVTGDSRQTDADGYIIRNITAPATDDARTWQGWGTALKPAFEPIVMGRKPLAGTVAANVLTYGTGALNIDGCRVGTTVETWPKSRARPNNSRDMHHDYTGGGSHTAETGDAPAGRWPPNVLLDPDSAAELDRQSGTLTSGANPTRRGADAMGKSYGGYAGQDDARPARGTDSGGASRFFPTFRYEAKAPTSQRPRADQVAHPTVKPLDLMRWLVRLVTPPGGTTLDPFAGSGTTGEAAILEHMHAILIEREPDYLPLIVKRLTKPMQVDLFGGQA
jgi:DNA modification methylase